jgi:hypothetical protein
MHFPHVTFCSFILVAQAFFRHDKASIGFLCCSGAGDGLGWEKSMLFRDWLILAVTSAVDQ